MVDRFVRDEAATTETRMAIRHRQRVEFVTVVSRDKRGRVVVKNDDGMTSEWNVRTGARWGDGGKFRMFSSSLTTESEGLKSQHTFDRTKEVNAFEDRINEALKPIGQYIRVERWHADKTRKTMLELANKLRSAAELLEAEAAGDIPSCE